MEFITLMYALCNKCLAVLLFYFLLYSLSCGVLNLEKEREISYEQW